MRQQTGFIYIPSLKAHVYKQKANFQPKGCSQQPRELWCGPAAKQDRFLSILHLADKTDRSVPDNPPEGEMICS